MFAPMPSMKSRKSGSVHPCICGCGLTTKRTWHPGHDGRATGWARRVTLGKLTLAEVPAEERRGAVLMLKRQGFTFRNPNPQQIAA